MKKKYKVNKLKQYIGFDTLKKDFMEFFKSLKKWSKRYFSTNILFMTFVLTSLINEYLVRFFTVKNYFNINPLVRYEELLNPMIFVFSFLR